MVLLLCVNDLNSFCSNLIPLRRTAGSKGPPFHVADRQTRAYVHTRNYGLRNADKPDLII